MAYTTPRNWFINTLVTAADLNEQVRDNVTYLHDQFDPTTGHDHDGSDAKGIAWGAVAPGDQVTWLPGNQAALLYYYGDHSPYSDPRGWAEVAAGAADGYFILPVVIPQTWAGQQVYIKSITAKVYYVTDGSLLFLTCALRRSNLSGAYTDEFNTRRQIDILPANTSVTLFSGTLVVRAAPYCLNCRVAIGMGTATVRIYGISITWGV